MKLLKLGQSNPHSQPGVQQPLTAAWIFPLKAVLLSHFICFIWHTFACFVFHHLPKCIKIAGRESHVTWALLVPVPLCIYIFMRSLATNQTLVKNWIPWAGC